MAHRLGVFDITTVNRKFKPNLQSSGFEVFPSTRHFPFAPGSAGPSQLTSTFGLTVNHFEHSKGRMLFSSTMSAKSRLGFGGASVLPLLAPYALLIRPEQTDFLSVAWLFAVIVSIGAIAVSILMLVVAVFGLNRNVEFNAATKTIRLTESHLMQRQREFEYAFADVSQIEVICHDWSDGPSTYEIRLTPITGKRFTFGNFRNHVDAESALSSLGTMLERPL